MRGKRKNERARKLECVSGESLSKLKRERGREKKKMRMRRRTRQQQSQYDSVVKKDRGMHGGVVEKQEK